VDPAIQRLLNTVDSGRVYETAKPGPEVPILRSESPYRQMIHPGESATLIVRSAARSPVTFWVRDGGMFPNQRASITVLSDDQGVAKTTLLANPGTIDDTSVLVGGLKSVGTITLVVHVVHAGSVEQPGVQP
jgi:hypothetical protein